MPVGMRVRAALLLVLASAAACSAVRPLLFWRDPGIRGTARLVDERGAPLAGRSLAGVTVNFIHRGGRIEDSILSAQTDAVGAYHSPALPPGEYAVEASLPDFAIETQSVQVRSHEHRRVDFVLKKIRETAGHSQREAQDENLPHPGEVQILPPPL
jgi:hypothetical protein